MTSTGENDAAEILRKLETAEASGIKRAKLVGTAKSKGHAQKLAAVESLLTQRQIVNLGTEKTPLLVLRKFYNPLELAYAAAEAKATPGAVKLYTDKELGKGLPKPTLEKLAEAISLLQRENKLIRIQRSKTVVYYLHVASITPLINAGAPAQAPSPAAPQTMEPSWEEIRQAYDSLVRNGGFSDVLISDLHKASAVPLESLKPWLLAQSRAGRLAPSRGDWSLADAPARAAAIELHGEPYLRVRLL